MRAAYSTGRVKLDARKIDHLINLGMRMFDDAGLYVSPSKMSHLTRDACRRWGYDIAALIIRQYLESREAADWESYRRALMCGRSR